MTSARVGLAGAVLLMTAAGVQAATVPTGFAVSRISGTLTSPTMVHAAPDGRVFVSEQAGRLRVIKNGTLLATPFLTVTTGIERERGLFGLAFDPNHATNRFVYIYYTATTPTVHNRISRFTASSTNPDVAVAGSEAVLLDLEPVNIDSQIHNAGALHFGPDGKLYITVGDNGDGNNAQSLGNTKGKILRINSDGTIPTDNPFFTTTTGINRAIWAYGLRNPFTFAFQPGTGRMFINDVGNKAWEEINEGARGANYGWPTTEGATSDPRFRTPFYTYAWSTTNCAIVGGAFYNPPTQNFPTTYVGKYFFGDHCAQTIKRIDPATRTVTGFATATGKLSDLTVASDGTIYYINRDAIAVERIRYTASQAPSIAVHPQSQTISAGSPVTFSVSANGTAPLSYQWQRGGVNIAGATAASYTFTTQLSDNGAQFRCVVSNSFGSATSNAATLTVVSNNAPTATITQPSSGTLVSGGEVVSYAGDASDPEDGTVAASGFEWEVRLHHGDHWHPYQGPITGTKTGSFTAATSGETSDDIWYRIHLRVRDSGGLRHEVTRDVLPRKAQVTLDTVPAGLSLTLDGTPVSAPHTFTGVAGVTRVLGAPSPQGGFHFASWSDGGAIVHNVVTPASGATYVATYRPAADYVEVTPPASGVTASTQDVNVPGNTVDNDLATRWSANGDGAWIKYDLGTTRTVGHVRIAVYSGNARRNRFDLQTSTDNLSWSTIWAGESSGTTTAEELYDFRDTPARWVRYLGHGSSASTFNSVSEVSVFAVGANTPTPTPTPVTPTPTPTPTVTTPTPTPTPITPTATPTPTPTDTPVGPVEITPPGAAVTASTNDGNLPANTVDGSLATRWSANGDAQWLQLDLGTTQAVSFVKIAFYSGNLRASRFDIQCSTGTTWSNLASGAQSSGASTGLETFDVADGNCRFVRYLGHGNTVNTWNSLTEIEVWQAAAGPTATPTPTPTATPTTPTPTPTATPVVPTPTPTATPSNPVEITPAGSSISASTNDGNLPANTVDGSLATRWSANGDGVWIQLDLGATRNVAFVQLATYNGNLRRSRFDLQYSTGGGVWSDLLVGRETSGTTTELETFDFADVGARWIRFVGHGNSVNLWNSYTEIEIWGQP